MIPVQNLQAGIRDARRMRDAIARGWGSAFAALRHEARAAADEGAPELHATLFPPPPRATKGKPSAATVPETRSSDVGAEQGSEAVLMIGADSRRFSMARSSQYPSAATHRANA